MVEVDRLIGELQQAKAYLQSEGERIEREAVGYVQLSQTALESVKIISETVGEWRKAGHPVRGGSGACSIVRRSCDATVRAARDDAFGP